MDKKVLFEKGITVVLGAWIGDKLGIILPALLLLGILMIVDYVSGMLASKKEALEHPSNRKYGLNSNKSIIGIYKKIGYVLTVLVAICSDYLIFEMVTKIGINYKTNTIFGLLVTTWFIINELLSILENAGRMGVELPKFILTVLTELKKDIEQKK